MTRLVAMGWVFLKFTGSSRPLGLEGLIWGILNDCSKWFAYRRRAWLTFLGCQEHLQCWRKTIASSLKMVLLFVFNLSFFFFHRKHYTFIGEIKQYRNVSWNMKINSLNVLIGKCLNKTYLSYIEFYVAIKKIEVKIYIKSLKCVR